MQAMSRIRRTATFAGAIGVMAAVAAGAGAAPPATGTADLAVDKADSPDPVATNGALTYTITVSNFGPDTATNVVVTDKLAGGLTYVSATSTAGKCNLKGNTVTCAVG